MSLHRIAANPSHVEDDGQVVFLEPALIYAQRGVTATLIYAQRGVTATRFAADARRCA